jgi:putative glutamine amidotransferase
MDRRPKIAITTRLEIGTGRFYLDRRYSEAIEASGGIPVMISLIPNKDYICEVMESVDGLLLPGSNTDIDPKYFGEEPHPSLGTVIPEKEETDLLALRFADERNLPIFAICFGMQALNVFRGGSIIQDISSSFPMSVKHDQGVPYDRSSHSIAVKGGRLLTDIASVSGTEGGIRVNSSHHQAVNTVGRDLIAVAWASDGIVEAIEDVRDERWVLGVQWHPEMTFKNDPLSSELFKVFVEQCGTSIIAL